MKRHTCLRFVLEDAGDHVILEWKPGITMQASDVAASVAAVTALSPHGSRPLLMRIGLVEHITAEAKQLLIRDISSSRIATIGTDDVGRVLTAFYYRSVTPSRYFTDETEAMTWLLADSVQHPSIFGESYGVEKAFSSEMDDGVLWVTWEQAFHITEPIAENIVLRAEFMNPTSCPPMLLELRQPMTATDRAMEILAEGLNIAAAAVTGAGPRGEALITYYNKRTHPPFPTRYFATVGQARHWLSTKRLTRHS